MVRPHWNRRDVTRALGAGLSSAAFVTWPRSAFADDAKTITVLNWQGYGTDLAAGLKEFKAATGHRRQARLLQLRTGDADQAQDQSRRL